MDLFLYALAFVIIMITIGIAENLSTKTIKTVFGSAFVIIIATISCTYVFSYTEVDEMHDVASYNTTVFAEPKTVIVETTHYPWWSINEPDSKWHVKDQE